MCILGSLRPRDIHTDQGLVTESARAAFPTPGSTGRRSRRQRQSPLISGLGLGLLCGQPRPGDRGKCGSVTANDPQLQPPRLQHQHRQR